MPKFYVYVYEDAVYTYKIEADSEEEAKENYTNGEVVKVREIGSEVVDVSKEWK